MLVDKVCDLLDVDWFLQECSARHNALVGNLGSNKANDNALKTRVLTLKYNVTNGAKNLQTQLDAIQKKINDAIKEMTDAFDSFVEALSNIFPAAKNGEHKSIINDNTLNNDSKLLFSGIQAQYLLLYLIILNVILFTGLIVYVSAKILSYKKGSNKSNHKYSITNLDSSDSDTSMFSS